MCLWLALATLAMFLPAMRNGFVDYDDGDYVTANAHVQSGVNWENIAWAFRTGHASNWHPLTWVSHMIDCQLFGQNAGAHHLMNVLFHVANTLLVFLVLRRMTGSHWRSALVAALFALHPLHVESVAWVSERKDVLSGFFFLLTLWAYSKYVTSVEGPASKKSEFRMPKSEGNPNAKNPNASASGTLHFALWYGLAVIFFALGLTSKPMLVTLPFVLLLLDYWPLRRVSGVPPPLLTSARQAEGRVTGGGNRSSIPWLILEKVPFFILSVVSSVITFLAQKHGGAVSTSISMGARIANALVSYGRYLGKFLWPQTLSVLYPHPGEWPAMQVLFCTALLLGVTVVVIALARRRPYLLVGWLWFLGTLVPVIGLIQVGIQSMADRYMYLPMLGLLVMLVWGIGEALPSLQWGVKAQKLASAISLGACACLSWRQEQYWRNSETLFRHTTKVTRDNYLAYNNLGFYLSHQGRMAEAMENYRSALKIRPNYEDAHNNLGYALAGQKKYVEAIAEYDEALRASPNHVEVHNNLGNALAETGNTEAAITHYRIALAQKPDHADAHNNLGIALAMQGKFDEAIEQFRDAIRYKPKYASAHSNLGNALAIQHKIEEAIKEYQESLRLNPEDPQAHNNLGNALSEEGRTEEAITHYMEALRLKADNPEAHFNLGMALGRQGKQKEAVAQYTEALRLKPDYVDAQKQLNLLLMR
ncbi:MAG: hypothetical protein QOJ40_2986, partial [Verrucomicrobiota bacterium]